MSNPSAERNVPKKKDHPTRSKESSSPPSPEDVSKESSPEESAPEGTHKESRARSSKRHRSSSRRTSSRKHRSGWERARPEEVRKREEQFRFLEEEATEYAVALLGSDGRIESWGQGARRLTGYSNQEALGHHISDFYLPEETGAWKRGLKAASRNGRWTKRGRRKRKDGSTFWAQETIRAIFRENEKPSGYAFLLRDLTRHRQIKKEILQVQEEEWERLKNDLHDIAGSQLTGANLLVEQARLEAEDLAADGQHAEGQKADVEGLAALLGRIKGLIEESSKALQKISRRLTPNGLFKENLSKEGLSKTNLEEALSRLAEDTECGHFEAGSFEEASPEEDSPEEGSSEGSSPGSGDKSGASLPELPNEVQLSEEEAKQLYWIAREALASARHQEDSEKALLRLTKETGGLVLLIKEEGGSLLPLEDKRHETNASEGAPSKRDTSEEATSLGDAAKGNTSKRDTSKRNTSERDAFKNDLSKHEKTPIPLRVMRRRAELLGAEIKAEPVPTGGTRIRCYLPT